MMNFNCIKDLSTLFHIFLLLPEISLGQKCSSDELNCISCTDYENCIDGVPEGRVISCKNGDSCTDILLKQCQMELNCYAMNECTQAGIFPDVMVDSNYYVCLSDANTGFLKYEFTCPEENFFDKSSLTCVPREVTLATSENPSSSSVPTDPTDPSPTTVPTDPTDPSPTTVPTDPTPPTPTMIPTDPSTPTTAPTDPSTPSTPSTALSTPTTAPTLPSIPTRPTLPSPTSSTSPFVCMTPGIFPNPNNCKMYYRCSTSLRSFFYICPGNSYFNENILKCSMVITPACQEQILKNSTSTPSPTMPSVTPTTTTLKPITTSTSTTTTTTTTPIPPKTATPPTTIITTIPHITTTITTPVTPTSSLSTTPLACLATGIFADPTDCKTYYRCAVSGKIFQYTCPGNTYFNEFTKRCSLTVTSRCKNLIQG